MVLTTAAMDRRHPHSPRLHSSESVFKLLKLAAVLAAAALFLVTSLHDARDFITQTSVTAGADAFVSALNSARVEALRRKVPVTVCKSPNPDHGSPHCAGKAGGWPEGWIAFVDQGARGAVDGSDQVLFAGKADAPIETAIEIPSRVAFITFHPVGPITGPADGVELRWGSALSTGTFERVICLSILGRASLARTGPCHTGPEERKK
jgi:type IV fimbrial biogenesis protein FimT